MTQITFPKTTYVVTIQPQGTVLEGQAGLNFLAQIEARDYIRSVDPETGTITYFNDKGSCVCVVEAVPKSETVTIDDNACDFGCGNCVCGSTSTSDSDSSSDSLSDSDSDSDSDSESSSENN